MRSEAWTWLPLEEVANQFQYGLSIRGEVTGRYPILRMNCQENGQVVLRDLQFVSLPVADALPYLLQRGDILFNRTNSHELVGRAAIFNHDLEAVFASYLIRVAVNKERIEPEFLNLFLNWDFTQGELKKLASRGVSQSNISAGKLREFCVPVPALEIQRHIVSAVHRVNCAMTVCAKTLDAAVDLKRAAMWELFTRGLRGEAQKETEIGLVPESWDVETLGTHHSVASGGTPARNVPAYWEQGDIPWVKTTEVDYGVIIDTEENITKEGLANSAAKMLPKGTLLMAMYGQGVTRGKVALLGMPATCNQACAAINAKDDCVIAQYLFHFLTYRYEEIRNLAHGGQQQNLNLDIVRDLPVAAPLTLEEQREIVAILDTIDRKIGLHKRKRAVLEDLFKVLLHKLMTGEIRMADLDLSALEPREPAAQAAAGA